MYYININNYEKKASLLRIILAQKSSNNSVQGIKRNFSKQILSLKLRTQSLSTYGNVLDEEKVLCFLSI